MFSFVKPSEKSAEISSIFLGRYFFKYAPPDGISKTFLMLEKSVVDIKLSNS